MEKSVLRRAAGRVAQPGDRVHETPFGTGADNQVLWPIHSSLYQEWMGKVFMCSDLEAAVYRSISWHQDINALGGFYYPSADKYRYHEWKWGVLAITNVHRFRQWLSENGEDVYGEFCP